MKICFVITKADEIGGAQIHIRDLTYHLLKDGCNPYVIVGESGALVNELRKNNIPVYIVKDLVREINPLKDTKSILEIRKLFKIISPDLISLHSSKAGIIGRLAAKSLNIPVIFTAHGWSFANGVRKKEEILYRFIEKKMTPLATKIITVSAQDKKLAIKYGVANSEQQIVIHNGMPKLPTLIPSKPKKEGAYTSLISVARFSNQKDHRTLFLALSQLKKFPWTLNLVGKGPLLDGAKQMVKEYDIEDKVFFLGERGDVAELLANSDIFLLISNWEGFPRSILEAMRAGLPVIASDVGGVSESVIHKETGYLVERGNVEDVKSKIESLLIDPMLCSNYGSAGMLRYNENFTFDAMYDKTKKLYEQLLNKN